jgi:hypothetical protein
MKIELKMYFGDYESLQTALLNVVDELQKCDMGTVDSYPFYIGSFRRIEDEIDVADLDSHIHW